MTREEAEALSSSMEADGGKQVRADVAAAADFVAGHARVRGPGFGVIGFSFGVDYALMFAADDPDRVRAVVVFYGTGPADHTRSEAAYLGHFAETDEFQPAARVEKLESALRAAGRRITFHTYAGTGHWFFQQDRTEAYNEAAAKLAWKRTLAFLRQELPSRPSGPTRIETSFE